MVEKVSTVWLLLCSAAWLPAAVGADNSSCSLYVDRRAKQLYVLDGNGRIVLQDAVGIGQGGLRAKRSMNDCVTPTGAFTIDLVLYKDRKFDAVSAENVSRYARFPRFSRLVSSPGGLNQLFHNMDSIDFNGDGKSDDAYGTGYIGLTSPNAITGPKMQLYRGIPYWFSIALHGTPAESGADGSESGGCVHLGAATLKALITKRLTHLGTTVIISNQPPKARTSVTTRPRDIVDDGPARHR